MMMYYYGDKNCIPCRETKEILDKWNIKYVFYDVTGVPEYEGRTPILILDDGRALQGKDAILNWFNIY